MSTAISKSISSNGSDRIGHKHIAGHIAAFPKRISRNPCHVFADGQGDNRRGSVIVRATVEDGIIIITTRIGAHLCAIRRIEMNRNQRWTVPEGIVFNGSHTLTNGKFRAMDTIKSVIANISSCIGNGNHAD